MNIFALISKIIGHFLFVIIFIFFSTLQAKEYKKFSKADFVSDYFSGILLLSQSKYNDSYKYLNTNFLVNIFQKQKKEIQEHHWIVILPIV